MLPFQLRYAVVLSCISSLSHIMVVTVRLTLYSEPSPHLINQVRPRGFSNLSPRALQSLRLDFVCRVHCYLRDVPFFVNHRNV